MADPAPRPRFRGALLGTAVGDAIGAPFEGQRRVDPDALARWSSADDPLRWTDDTAMTMGFAESLIAVGGFDGPHLAGRFIAHHDAEPWRGYGGTPPRIFAEIKAGAAWDAPARAAFGGSGSHGNGAAMRAAPAGLLHHGEPAAAAALARKGAVVTHTHELALQGAAVQAAAVAWLTAAEPGDVDELLDHLRPLAPAEQYRAAFDVLAELRNQRRRDGRVAGADEVVGRIGTGVAAAEAVPAAVHALLTHPSSLAEAVRYAVHLGGDADTVAAMTGAMSGALLGEQAIPPAWLDRLEARDRLVELADGLCAAAG